MTEIWEEGYNSIWRCPSCWLILKACGTSKGLVPCNKIKSDTLVRSGDEEFSDGVLGVPLLRYIWTVLRAQKGNWGILIQFLLVHVVYCYAVKASLEPLPPVYTQN